MRSYNYQNNRLIMNSIQVRNSVWGLANHCRVLTWLIPFLVAVPFCTKEGVLPVDAALFKSLMIVTGSVTAAALMI
jgi:hypothetical protein